MKHNVTRESQPQPNEQRQPRRRSVYDHDGEYEFLFAQHWKLRQIRRRLSDSRPRLAYIRPALLTHYEARRIAANIAKLPGLLTRK